MDLNQQVSEILADAERRLVLLVAAALENREYALAQRLSAIAGRISEANIIDGDGFGGNRKALPPKRAADTSRQARGQFPRFYREENQLVKIGYSKSERRTYEHRSPREVLDRLANLLLVIGVDGKQFSTERILPPLEKVFRDVPSYQVYLCLAFLVLNGLVQKHGRSGYSVAAAHTGDLPTAVQASWQALPMR